jgi:hypothetical protein
MAPGPATSHRVLADRVTSGVCATAVIHAVSLTNGAIRDFIEFQEELPLPPGPGGSECEQRGKHVGREERNKAYTPVMLIQPQFRQQPPPSSPADTTAITADIIAERMAKARAA